jgi:hypothetical protein
MDEELCELSYQEFVSARKQYWQLEPRSAAQSVSLPNSETAPFVEEDSNFVLYAPGLGEIYGVFEDSGKTGWFYLYDAQQRKILKAAHIYDRAKVVVNEDVVDIGWAEDGSACGLAVWGEFRAFLGASADLNLRKPVMSAEESGIPASDWPCGFERYLEKKIS